MVNKYGLLISLHGGTAITTDDSLDNEDSSIEQMINYGKNGYYSRTRKEYYPPNRIESIHLIIANPNK